MSTASLSKNQWKFSPQNIPGCQLWLDAADTTCLTYSGSSVTAWRDKSGNGYTMNTLTAAPIGYSQASPTTGTPINGLNTVNFVPGAGLKQATTLDGVKNLYWVGRLVTTDVVEGGANCFFLLGHDFSYDWHGDTPAVGTYLNGTYSQAGIYNATPVSQYGGGAAAAVNTTFSALQFPASGVVSFVSAAGITGSTLYQGICYDRGTHCGWSGDLAEVILFSEVLTTTQHQQIEGYLAAKWGLYAELPVTHPYYSSVISRPIYARPFQPVDIDGCQLWLDAADRSAITFSSGTTVSVWKDKSGNGNNGTANGTVVWDANGLGTNLPGMTFTNSQRFYGNISITGDQFTAFAIFNMNEATTFAGRILSLGVNDAYDFNNNSYIAALCRLEGTNFVSYRNDSYPTIQITIGQNELVTTWVDGSDSYLSQYGGTPASVGSSGNFAISAYAVGDEAWINTDGSALIDGYVSEVIVFNRSLTTSQRQQVEAYLAWKWGLRANLPITHPGYTLPSYAVKFTPKSISGLYLWLDAADSSTLVMSGSSVTSWNDKSGNGFSATPMDSAVTLRSQNNNPTIYLPSIRMAIPNFTWNYAFTIIIACKCLYSNMMVGFGAGLSPGDAWLGYVETGNWSLFYMSNPYIATTDPNFIQGPTDPYPGEPASVGPANQWFIFSIGYNNGAYLTNYAINGTPYNANPMTPQSGSQTGYMILNGLPSYPYDSDDIGEIVHFNYSISTYQRQQVEGYLAWKWGIASSLPSTHPFAKISP